MLVISQYSNNCSKNFLLLRYAYNIFRARAYFTCTNTHFNAIIISNIVVDNKKYKRR